MGNFRKNFKEEEVWEALKVMAPLKSSSNDGFPALFSQKYWYIVGKEVTRYYLGVLNDQKEIRDVSSTNIVLILKVRNPKNMSQFGPINLCSVVYKTIVNRFRKALSYCIEETHGVFVPGRCNPLNPT